MSMLALLITPPKHIERQVFQSPWRYLFSYYNKQFTLSGQATCFRSVAWAGEPCYPAGPMSRIALAMLHTTAPFDKFIILLHYETLYQGSFKALLFEPRASRHHNCKSETCLASDAGSSQGFIEQYRTFKVRINAQYRRIAFSIVSAFLWTSYCRVVAVQTSLRSRQRHVLTRPSATAISHLVNTTSHLTWTLANVNKSSFSTRSFRN